LPPDLFSQEAAGRSILVLAEAKVYLPGLLCAELSHFVEAMGIKCEEP
jgi:hypothetical protein